LREDTPDLAVSTHRTTQDHQQYAAAQNTQNIIAESAENELVLKQIL